MTRPAVTFGDPERAVIAHLKTTGLVATIKNQAPTGPLGTAKHVQVEHDGSPSSDYPITERATVRVTCYAGNGRRDEVKALASQVQSLLYTWPGDDEVYGTRPLAGRSSIVTDPDTGNLMVWFTFRLSLSPQSTP